jgi:hypothetical protein
MARQVRQARKTRKTPPPLTPRWLDLAAPLPTYKIDRILLDCADLHDINMGVARYWRETAERSRSAFNKALQILLMSDEKASDKERRQRQLARWEAKNARIDALFADIRRLRDCINNTDAKRVLPAALPRDEWLAKCSGEPPDYDDERFQEWFTERYGEWPDDDDDKRYYDEWSDGDDKGKTVKQAFIEWLEQQYDGDDERKAVEQAFDELKTALDLFLARVYIVQWPRHRGGNHDRLASTYIAVLANSRLWPFTPVTCDNFKDFARLLAAGWEDLGLPLDYSGYGKRNYDSLYEFIYERVRKHPILKSRISPPPE